MNEEVSASLAKVEEILGGVFKVSGAGKKSLAKKQSKLRAAGFDAKVGTINHAGRASDGTLQVQFDSGGQGWSSRWPDWAYEPARDSVLHGKKVWVIYQGDAPFGPNLLQVLILQ